MSTRPRETRRNPRWSVAKGEAVDPAEYYMRTQPRLHTGDPRYEWVNRTVFVGTGARFASAVEIGIWEVV